MIRQLRGCPEAQESQSEARDQNTNQLISNEKIIFNPAARWGFFMPKNNLKFWRPIS